MRALISVFNKEGIAPFAKELDGLGVEIVSTGGTAKALKAEGIKVNSVTSLTHFPEIMDGRVKTLNPFIHGGILAVREDQAHMKTVEELKIPLIDLVVVNLYPFEATIAKEGMALDEIIEMIDIGGPTMIRSAAKNYQDVLVVVNPARYSEIIDHLKKDGNVPLELRQKLALEAFQHTGYYDSVISAFFRQQFTPDEPLAAEMSIGLKKIDDLRYGENSHQQAALYQVGQPSGLIRVDQVQGKALSFNNYIDTQAAYDMVKRFQEPAAVVVKHTNPCGVAISDSIANAYKKAYEADSVSAFGGIVGLNRDCDEATAKQIAAIFVEVVIAPGYSKKALEIFAQKKNLRILIKKDFFADTKELDVRKVEGGLLLQDKDRDASTPDQWTTASKRQATDQEKIDLAVGWQIIPTVKSNAILLVKDGVMVGVGAGQMSRVEAVELALKRAGDKAQGSVLVSDAFFPFGDSLELAAKAGITAVVQPGGSIRDEESVKVVDQYKMAMLFTGIRHFRH